MLTANMFDTIIKKSQRSPLLAWRVKKAMFSQFETTENKTKLLCDFVYYFDHFSRILLGKNRISKLFVFKMKHFSFSKMQKCLRVGLTFLRDYFPFTLLAVFSLLPGALLAEFIDKEIKRKKIRIFSNHAI